MFLAGSCGYDLFGKSMRSKITLKKLLFIASVVAVVLYVIVLFLVPILHNRLSYAKTPPQVSSQTLQSPIEDRSVVPVVAAQQANSGLPVRLKIPEIDLDATIEYVGLKTNGEMGVPKDPANVAWFNIGARPGDVGSAVIAGHFGVLGNGEGSVFDNLKKLKKSDKIFIENDKGATIAFVVRENRNYDADADASSVFTSSDGKSHLNLVTCQGWDKVSENYTKRFVVFADKK